MNRIVVVLAVVLLLVAPVYAAAPTPTVAPSPTPTTIAGDFWDDMSGPTVAGQPDYENGGKAVYHQNGQLHFEAKKTRESNGELKQYFGISRVYPSHYQDMTLEVDAGRISGEGFGGGQAGIIFGYRNDENLYYLGVLRVGQRWMVMKRLHGKDTNIIPGGPMDRWNVGQTVHNAAITTGDAWDRFKIVVEGQNDGTWIGVYANDTLLGYAKDTDYGGGAVGLGVFTYGNEAHVVFDNLHVAPTGKH